MQFGTEERYILKRCKSPLVSHLFCFSVISTVSHVSSTPRKLCREAFFVLAPRRTWTAAAAAMSHFSEGNMVFRVQSFSIGMKISVFVHSRRKDRSYEHINSIISCCQGARQTWMSTYMRNEERFLMWSIKAWVFEKRVYNSSSRLYKKVVRKLGKREARYLESVYTLKDNGWRDKRAYKAYNSTLCIENR